MDFTRFVSLIDKKSLFFARADRLGDPFEGSTTTVNTSMHSVTYGDLANPRLLNQISLVRQSLRRFHLVNCWHLSEDESDAMWTQYSRQYDGIAVKTDFRALADSFRGDTPVYVGKVKYVDYSNAYIPEGNCFNFFLHKRKAFEHEKEVRAITFEFPPKEDRIQSNGIIDLPDVCEFGRYLDIEIGTLIHEVVVAPFAPDWFIELVRSVTAQYNLTFSVRKSTLSAQPVWG